MSEKKTLQEKAMLSKLTVKMWYAETTDREVKEEISGTHAVKGDPGYFIKYIIPKKVLSNLFGIANNAKVTHNSQTLPWFDDKFRILPSANFFVYREKMKPFEDSWKEAVEDLLSNYESLIEESKVRLSSLFKADDYPSKETIRRKLRFSISILPIPDSSDFRVDLGDEETNRIKQELDEQVKKATKDALKDTWERLYAVVSKFTEVLPKYKPDEKGGKKNTFHESMVNNTVELCELLPKLNIMGDKKLEKMRKEVVSKLTKNTAKTLREDEAERKSTLENATTILEAMKPFIS